MLQHPLVFRAPPQQVVGLAIHQELGSGVDHHQAQPKVRFIRRRAEANRFFDVHHEALKLFHGMKRARQRSGQLPVCRLHPSARTRLADRYRGAGSSRDRPAALSDGVEPAVQEAPRRSI